MKNRKIIIVLTLAVALQTCSQAPKPAKATRQKPVPAAAQPSPEDTAKQEASKAAPAPLPVLGKNDINGDSQVQAEKAEDPEKEASILLEEGLVAYQEARTAIDRGDMDAALAKLDEAYGIILKVKLKPDSPLIQEKNDLRILLAQRIQQVNASRLTTVPSINNSIPLIENQWVKKEIENFQGGEKPYFEEGYKRSGLYRDMIVSELKKAGLPEQLSWVPLIESWFRVRAQSRARALGIWQFIASTGYRYGLKRDKFIDERMDPVKATNAAIQYLNDLHGLFGDWTTALAAYDCGEGYVQKVIRGQQVNYLDNFWDLFNNLPWETARYLPRFIAALMIIENPAKYGFSLPTPDPPLKHETVRINAAVKLAGLAQTMGIDPLLLTILNPELRFDSTPNYEYELRVPEGYRDKCLACLPALPTYTPPDAVFSGWHTVRPGETLGSIAHRYRTSVSALVRINGLSSARLIYPGQRLKIPGVPATETAPANPSSNAKANPGETVQYVVKAGDTLFQLAKIFNTSIERIKSENGLSTDELTVGQKLVIHEPLAPGHSAR